MISNYGRPLLFCTLFMASTAWATPDPMTRDAIVANSKSVVGFSYWWGGAAWLPGSASKGKCTPTASGGCPSCTHSGSYGADCSGFVAKAWQIDKPTDLDKNYHPYSTWHFDNSTTWWTKPAKGDAQRADAFNYNTNGAGHVWMFDKGDPWGSAYAWECKGCAYGCVYNLRTVSSYYGLIRRKLISDPPACSKHCEGTAVVDENCNKGDCAAYAASCVSDSLGVRCVSNFCPAKGTASVCLPDAKNGKIATCDNGSLKDPGDCGSYGAWCSTALGGNAKCVSGLCASSAAAKPVAGDLCHNGKRYSCSASGDIAEAPCPADQPCQTATGKTGPGSGSCGPKPCDSCDDGNACSDDGCDNGVCVHTAVASKPCDDGDSCSEGDTCTGGKCLGSPKNCDDGVACSTDSCSGGTCGHVGDDVLCDDGNPCTADLCSKSGCTHGNQDGACDDGDGCTVGSGCKDGACVTGSAARCDDENTCTKDSCQEGGCLHTPLDGTCSDGNGCTEGDYCAQGQCLAGKDRNCEDGFVCTLDRCIDGGCVHPGGTPQVPACQGNDVWLASPCPGEPGQLRQCFGGSKCVAGTCAGGTGGDAGSGDGLGSLGDGTGSSPAKSVVAASPSGCNGGRALHAGWLLVGMASLVVALRRRRA